jgi:hypothetical protein
MPILMRVCTKLSGRLEIVFSFITGAAAKKVGDNDGMFLKPALPDTAADG